MDYNEKIGGGGKLQVLNLYAGIGGNRKHWPDNIEVTAVEYDEQIAAIYKEYFPHDKVIITDAHQFLLDHYAEYNFIWSSRPCITHSRSRMWASKGGKYPPLYPDMKLYEEIIFLDNFFEGKYVVENVVPYYELHKFMIKPCLQIDRHLIWSNFRITPFTPNDSDRDHNAIGQSIYGFDLTDRKISNRKDQIIRNCVNPELGIHVFNCATGFLKSEYSIQTCLFPTM